MRLMQARILLELEKARIQREKARLVLEKSITFYFLFMLVGVLGFINGYVTKNTLNILIISGIVILIAGTLPYIRIASKQEKKIDSL